MASIGWTLERQRHGIELNSPCDPIEDRRNVFDQVCGKFLGSKGSSDTTALQGPTFAEIQCNLELCHANAVGRCTLMEYGCTVLYCNRNTHRPGPKCQSGVNYNHRQATVRACMRRIRSNFFFFFKGSDCHDEWLFWLLTAESQTVSSMAQSTPSHGAMVGGIYYLTYSSSCHDTLVERRR